MGERGEVIVRYVRLREELEPMDIVDGATLASLPGDWLAITRLFASPHPGRDPMEHFMLYLLTDTGEKSESLTFDTLQIALDQAQAIFGVEHDEWHSAEVRLSRDDEWVDRIPWAFVA